MLYDPRGEAVGVVQLLSRRGRQPMGCGEVIRSSGFIELDDTGLRPGDVVLNFAAPGFPGAEALAPPTN